MLRSGMEARPYRNYVECGFHAAPISYTKSLQIKSQAKKRKCFAGK